MGKTLHLGVGVHYRGHDEIEQAAHSAHKIDDGVTLGAQRLGGNIGHEGHGGGTVGAHGHQQQAQHDDKGGHLEGAGVIGVAVVDKGQDVYKNDGKAGAEEDIGHALADSGVCPVGYAAEEGQQEQSQDIIRRHDCAGEGLVQVEGVGKDKGDNAVIHLPEGGDGQEGKTHKNGSFIIELHWITSGFFQIPKIILHY